MVIVLQTVVKVIVSSLITFHIITNRSDYFHFTICIAIALKNLKNNIKMVLIFKGIVFIVMIKIISNLLNLYAVGLLLQFPIFILFFMIF